MNFEVRSASHCRSIITFPYFPDRSPTHEYIDCSSVLDEAYGFYRSHFHILSGSVFLRRPSSTPALSNVKCLVLDSNTFPRPDPDLKRYRQSCRPCYSIPSAGTYEYDPIRKFPHSALSAFPASQLYQLPQRKSGSQEHSDSFPGIVTRLRSLDFPSSPRMPKHLVITSQ
jgi:hypothetical protein